MSKTYVEINNQRFEASINGTLNNYQWGNRDTKAITLAMTYDEAIKLFTDGVEWKIVETYEEDEYDIDMNKTVVEKEREWDNSEYQLSGDIVDHRDGTITIYMGKLTDLEEAYALLIGG